MTVLPLTASGLQHAYGSNYVLKGVDLELRPGQLVVVLGPNGSGKTTLLRILCGVLRQSSGTVAIGGRPIERMSRREIARALAVVPQETSVPFPYRVHEMVAMGRAPFLGPLGRESQGDREVIGNALASLALTELAERRFPTLSGGEKQRVVLARALAQQTDVMLLDEPTAHMDLGHRIHTFEWLQAWIAERSSERAVLLVTHDLVLGARFADAIVLLHRGCVVAEGAAQRVLTPERIAEVYGVEARVSQDENARPVIIAVRSQIG